MTYIGELISIGVAFSWTATALLSEFGSKRLGNLTLNVLRMALALVFSLVHGMDAAFRTGRICDRRLLPVSVLYHHWFALRPAVYDAGATGCSLDGLDHTWSAAVRLGPACHVHHPVGYQHLCSWPRRASQGVAQIAAQRRAVCHRSCYVPRYRTGT